MAHRTEEDRIIENIVIDGRKRLYDDTDFLPIRQSLYNVQTIIPDYDDDAAHRITWARPHTISETSEYFRPSQVFNHIQCKQNTLPDEVFLGTLMAVAVYPGQDLLENIFASHPDHFSVYGVYTCRFYVEGEWVDVITDTNLPCIRNELTGICSPAYGQSSNPDEMWVALAQKAYAKAVGSYEAIQKVKVHDALLHLTGGSVQQLSLKDDSSKELSVAGGTFKMLNRNLKNDTLIVLLPADKNAAAASDGAAAGGSSGGADEDAKEDLNDDSKAEDHFLHNRLYSVIACRDIGGFELILLHNPWDAHPSCWRGSWSEDSPDWDLYPEICQELEEDSSLPWTRSNPNGYFWMTGKMVNRFFNAVYLCKLFPNEKFSFYCMRGEWRGRLAGGPATTIREKAVVIRDAAASRQNAITRATAAVVIDGDAAWFNNPQYKVSVTKPATVYVSVLPASGNDSDATVAVTVTIVSFPKVTTTPLHPHLWDSALTEVVADGSGSARTKGQECALWAVELDPRRVYYVVPHTMRRGLEAPFIVRLFSSEPLSAERVAPLLSQSLDGAWVRNSDLDTTGGPVQVSADGVLTENPKWCHNPQFHLEVTDPYGKAEVYLKIVVRRVDKEKAGGGRPPAGADAKADVYVGLVVAKAECLEDNSAAKKKKQPRQNALGELMPTKESSLKKRPTGPSEDGAPTRSDSGKTVLRKTSVLRDSFFLESSFTSKSEATIFFPKVPRAWMPNGLIVVPCLTDKGTRGKFELEVYASEAFTMNQLPDSYSRTIAGEWAEGCAGGAHLNPGWKKNPRFSLNIRNTTRSQPSNVRITLSRSGVNWRSLSKRDTVGCMIGFYIFSSNTSTGDSQQIYESTFVPAEELSTEPSFTLDQLPAECEYVIMPATHGENKFGHFVLSIIAEHEFTLRKEK